MFMVDYSISIQGGKKQNKTKELTVVKRVCGLSNLISVELIVSLNYQKLSNDFFLIFNFYLYSLTFLK